MLSHSAVSDSLQSHVLEPTRLPRPWDPPGKNTGVGCHFLLQCMKVKSESEVAQSCPTLSNPWTAAFQAPPSMRLSRQEYWSGLPLPSPSFLLVICFTHCSIYMSMLLILTHSFSHYVYKSMLYVCVSIPALQIGSLVAFF